MCSCCQAHERALHEHSMFRRQLSACALVLTHGILLLQPAPDLTPLRLIARTGAAGEDQSTGAELTIGHVIATCNLVSCTDALRLRWTKGKTLAAWQCVSGLPKLSHISLSRSDCTSMQSQRFSCCFDSSAAGAYQGWGRGRVT